MQRDEDHLARVQQGSVPFLFRLYRFAEPTVSYGRLQNPRTVQQSAPAGWPLVQRPTGGGMVFHENDLCFSIAWRPGATPIPTKPTEQYSWIHNLVQEALKPYLTLKRFSCQDAGAAPAPFHERQCFQEPVPCDLLQDGRKVVGGALAHRRHAVLYQGSIQSAPLAFEEPLFAALQKGLGPCLSRSSFPF